jgi:sulfoxide reductase heme-binding subunit YedZ
MRLHRLVYVIAILGVWHYWWGVKKDIREPLLYVCGLSLLLGYRLWKKRTVSRISVARVAGTDAS